MKWQLKKLNKAVCLKSPVEWGPCMWKFLHTSAFNYPEKPSGKLMMHTLCFIQSLPHMLPCPSCHTSAFEFVSDCQALILEAITSRDKLFAFYVKFHNYVNAKKTPSTPEMSVEMAWKLYSGEYVIELVD